MTRATITIDREFTAGQVPRRLFGSFVEHMGRCVYTGIYEPSHPTADSHGLRQDVVDLTREMGVSVVRYPGGNFVSGYNWEDGVGPRSERPRRLDGAWHTVERNEFGLHEFMEWSKQTDVEVMEAVNLGTRGVDAARNLVEYCNHPGGTELSDRRARNGSKEPFDIKLWCLGNEMDGPWQIGHKTAHEYGRLASEAAKAMRYVDPSIELVLVGSSSFRMETFGEWEQTVLGHAYNDVDYISLHAYYQETDDDTPSFLATAVDMDRFIEAVVSTVDAVRARGKHRKHVNLSFDEWNVWHKRGLEADQPKALAGGGWREHPRIIEDTYNVTDAVVVGTLLHSLLRHGHRVTIANQAQLANVIAPIRTEAGGPAWRQTIFWPFARMAEVARGTILQTAVSSDRTETKKFDAVDLVDVAATWDESTDHVAFFVANRTLDDSANIEIAMHGFSAVRVTRAEVLCAPEATDRKATNDLDAGERVQMQHLTGVNVTEQGISLTMPAVSWALVEVEVAST